MFEQEIRELFELTLRAQEETRAFVCLTYASRLYMTIAIYDKGYDKGMEADGAYSMSLDAGHPEYVLAEFAKAKKHLEELIIDGKVGLV